MFYDFPARNVDFVGATGCSTSVLQFCEHWIENVNVSGCGLLLWPHGKQYVEMVRKGELPNPKCKSFDFVNDSCAAFPVKVGVFNGVARQITTFLTMYKPKLPFLSEDMLKMIKGKEIWIIIDKLTTICMCVIRLIQYLRCFVFKIHGTERIIPSAVY